MLYGLFLTVYIISCFLLVLIVLIQKGKGGLGLSSISSSSQMLFGGSGGQDILQKITWTLGAIFIGGALVLSIAKTKQHKTFRYVQTAAQHTTDSSGK